MSNVKSYYIGEIHSEVNVESLGVQLKILGHQLIQQDPGTKLIVFKGKGYEHYLQVWNSNPNISILQTITSCTFTHEAPFVEIFKNQFRDLIWYKFNIETGILDLTPIPENQRTFY